MKTIVIMIMPKGMAHDVVSLGCTPIQNKHMMFKVEKKKLNGRSCIAVASSTAIKSKQTYQSLLLVPSI